MLRLWASFLATIYVAIVATKRPPEYWRLGGARLVRLKVANYRKEVISQAKKMQVGRSRVQIVEPSWFFTSKFPLKWLLTIYSRLWSCECEMQFIERSPVLQQWLINVPDFNRAESGVGQNNMEKVGIDKKCRRKRYQWLFCKSQTSFSRLFFSLTFLFCLECVSKEM